LRTLAKVVLLLIGDFAIGPLSDQGKRDLLEILDDRYDKSAAIITPVSSTSSTGTPTSMIRLWQTQSWIAWSTTPITWT
jgi:DNA replication protein DnaC